MPVFQPDTVPTGERLTLGASESESEDDAEPPPPVERPPRTLKYGELAARHPLRSVLRRNPVGAPGGRTRRRARRARVAHRAPHLPVSPRARGDSRLGALANDSLPPATPGVPRRARSGRQSPFRRDPRHATALRCARWCAST